MTGPAREARVIGAADEMLALIEQVQSAQDAFNAFADSRVAVLFWRSYLQSRAGGGKPPEAILRVLDSVVANMLSAATPEAVLAATGLGPAPIGAGRPKDADTTLQTSQLCRELWAAAARVQGLKRPTAEPPERLPPGVLADVALRFFGAADANTQSRLRKRWERWKRSPARDGTADLADVMRLMARPSVTPRQE